MRKMLAPPDCYTVAEPFPIRLRKAGRWEPAITVTNLRKTFRLSAKQRKLERTDARTKTAVDGLTFEVRRGEIYGLLGPNGAGKTTTLRMLAALVKPDEGSAFVEGVSVVDDPMRVQRDHRVPDERAQAGGDVLAGLPVRLLLGAAPRGAGRARRAQKGAVRALRHRPVRSRRRCRPVHRMKQKTSLAVSLVHDPDVIIFDEPHERPRRAHGEGRDRLPGGAEGPGQDHPLVHAHIQPGGEGVRPCRHRHRRTHGGQRHPALELTQGRSLEDAFFDLYAASVGEAS